VAEKWFSYVLCSYRTAHRLQIKLLRKVRLANQPPEVCATSTLTSIHSFSPLIAKSGLTLTLEHSSAVPETSWMADTNPAVTSLFQPIRVRRHAGVAGSDAVTVVLRLGKTGGSTDTTGLSLDPEMPVNKGLTSTCLKPYCGRLNFFVDGGMAGRRCGVRPGVRDHHPVSRIQLDGVV
jgi:hypothetical protein